MRYENWDILLFPRDCKVPIKEFKVACHVVYDSEFSHINGSCGVPTVSIHCWNVPVISQFTKAYSKYADNGKFEARLFLDGRLVASASLDKKSIWPHIMAHGFDFSKNGDLETLRFPAFRQELLHQNYWSPADELGRIKIVLSEGFPRDSQTMPFERVKNIVAFSFQHAPMEILESSSIAWPNPAMWQRAPFAASTHVPTYQGDDADAHAHSPRRRHSNRGSLAYAPAAKQLLPQVTLTAPAVRRSTYPLTASYSADPFGDATSYFEWLNGTGSHDAYSRQAQRSTRKSSTDVSMPDYVPTRFVPEAPGTFGLDDEKNICHLQVPTNTPTADTSMNQDGVPFPVLSQSTLFPSDLADSLTNSLLNQPMPMHGPQHGFETPAAEVKSRKENRRPDGQSSTTVADQHPNHVDLRRVSQQMCVPQGCSVPASSANMADGGAHSARASPGNKSETLTGDACPEKGVKRSRHFTPASARVIDEEDEPRVSPHARLQVPGLGAEQRPE